MAGELFEVERHTEYLTFIAAMIYSGGHCKNAWEAVEQADKLIDTAKRFAKQHYPSPKAQAHAAP